MSSCVPNRVELMLCWHSWHSWLEVQGKNADILAPNRRTPFRKSLSGLKAVNEDFERGGGVAMIFTKSKVNRDCVFVHSNRVAAYAGIFMQTADLPSAKASDVELGTRDATALRYPSRLRKGRGQNGIGVIYSRLSTSPSLVDFLRSLQLCFRRRWPVRSIHPACLRLSSSWTGTRLIWNLDGDHKLNPEKNTVQQAQQI
ncbi:uncharacterized protein FOMMEDRAFT_156528 [Fomitiporia mediterranea MF3/22]|uniref:uncharacterized protein n=1 Tax=Fomitiporia mediterranea (strain MF3/22) TaxID=694068 RepID=UPI00044081D0|nr:uncharacterized protein FOMMEDRAFT_156528 [Fomitiporia mediterranea MF3/22]EJD03155.1 hypothetical protein FOMMEDRAFT_156528 [Fomitiporia mediterranea MF3/22]